jgi:hypothetical protein
MRIVLATLLSALLAGGLADPDTVTIHLTGDWPQIPAPACNSLVNMID